MGYHVPGLKAGICLSVVGAAVWAAIWWNERKNNRCPECKGIYTVIRFANPSDEEYLDRVSMRFSE